MDIPFGTVEWNMKLRFNEEYMFFKRKGRHALVTNIGVFQNCSLEQRDTNYAILDSSEAERGHIQYDTKASEDLYAERCVVVGMDSYEYEHGLRSKKYYILVVRRTRVDGEYTRVGVGWIRSDYVRRQRLKVRVV